MDQHSGGSRRRGGWSWWYLLFVVQFVAVLWPPFYNKVEPSWIGIPFFYWYQLVCVLVGGRAHRDRVLRHRRLERSAGAMR